MRGANGKRRLLILHFNDVYNIEAGTREPVGGAARFAWKVKSFKEENPLILFSGDCLNPSTMSTVTRGQHMAPILNALGVHVACLGNHDLDFGLENFEKFAGACAFPWLVANILDKDTGEPIGGMGRVWMVETSGVKVGVVGLVEHEWLATLATVDEGDLHYIDFISEGAKQAAHLREQGAELVVAVTHMRAPNDRKLLEHVMGVDIVCGGHDHSYQVATVEPHHNLLVKSGTDFRDLTSVIVTFEANGEKSYQCERHAITGDVPEDPEVAQIVRQYEDRMGDALDERLGEAAVDIDGRFSSVRTAETNLGNFVCDVLRVALKCDVVLLNSGTFRSDRIHPKGLFTKRDLVQILPMVDETVVLRVTGAQLLAALENSVSQFPKLEGRFCQVSGLKFAFDPAADVGHRIQAAALVTDDGEAAVKDSLTYKLGTKAYLAQGRDGFDMFRSAEVALCAEESPMVPTAIRNHFTMLEVLDRWQDSVSSEHRLVHRFVAKLKGSVRDLRARETTKRSRTAVWDPSTNRHVVCPVRDGRILCLTTEGAQ